MNRLFLLLYSMLFCSLVSCSGSNKSTDTGKAVKKTDSCLVDSRNTYEVYIPARKNDAKLPLLVILDAHGNGKLALEKFIQGANQYQAVLIASNLIKNGYEGYEQAIQTLIDDVRQKYPVGEMVFMTGFSGGARMALDYGLAHPLNGLIMCGALAGSDQLLALHCPVISISGMDDFNFMETAQYLFQDQSTPANLMIELTNGSHNWPDSILLRNALGFLYLSGNKVAKLSADEKQLRIYGRQQQARMDVLKQQGDYLKAAVIARNMASSEPFNNDPSFASAYRELKTSQGYLSQLNRLEKCLQVEISMRQPYLEAFQNKDTLWWKKEISTTDMKIKTEQDAFTTDMYRRIKSFWGIAAYSLCKQAVSQKDAVALDKILSVYRILEPQNPDMLYFCAFPSFWSGKYEATINQLKKAFKAGFSDRSRLKKDFPGSITSKL
jgi:predicted esterase